MEGEKTHIQTYSVQNPYNIPPEDLRDIFHEKIPFPDQAGNFLGRESLEMIDSFVHNSDLIDTDILALSGELEPEQLSQYISMVSAFDLIEKNSDAIAQRISGRLSPKLSGHYIDSSLNSNDQIITNQGIWKMITTLYNIIMSQMTREVKSVRNVFIRHLFKKSFAYICIEAIKELKINPYRSDIFEIILETFQQKEDFYMKLYDIYKCIKYGIYSFQEPVLDSVLKNLRDYQTEHPDLNSLRSENESLFSCIRELTYFRSITTGQFAIGNTNLVISGKDWIKDPRQGENLCSCYISFENDPFLKSYAKNLGTNHRVVYMNFKVPSSLIFDLDERNGSLRFAETHVPLTWGSIPPRVYEEVRNKLFRHLFDQLLNKADDIPEHFLHENISEKVQDIIQNPSGASLETKPEVMPTATYSETLEQQIQRYKYQKDDFGNFTCDEVKRTLAKILGAPETGGRHINFRHKSGKGRYPIPYHPSDHMGYGVLKRCLMNLGIPPGEFLEHSGRKNGR